MQLGIFFVCSQKCKKIPPFYILRVKKSARNVFLSLSILRLSPFPSFRTRKIGILHRKGKGGFFLFSLVPFLGLWPSQECGKGPRGKRRRKRKWRVKQKKSWLFCMREAFFSFFRHPRPRYLSPSFPHITYFGAAYRIAVGRKKQKGDIPYRKREMRNFRLQFPNFSRKRNRTRKTFLIHFSPTKNCVIPHAVRFWWFQRVYSSACSYPPHHVPTFSPLSSSHFPKWIMRTVPTPLFFVPSPPHSNSHFLISISFSPALPPP